MSDLITIIAPSGIKVEFNISDYSTCYDLFKAVLKAVRQGGLSTKLPEGIQLSELGTFAERDIRDLAGLGDAIIDIITSKECEDLIFKCMERATYDGQRITGRSFFEDINRRGDFLWIVKEIGWANIRPFVSHLTFGLGDTSPQAEKKISQP